MDRQSMENDFIYDLCAISDFGTFQAIKEDLENAEKKEKSVVIPKSKKKKNNRKNVIIVPSMDELEENEALYQESNIPYYRNSHAEELKEIDSGVYRNETIECYMNHCLENLDICDVEEEDVENNEEEIAAIPTSNTEEQVEKTVIGSDSNSSVGSLTVEPKKKKSRKHKNAFLNSLKNSGKLNTLAQEPETTKQEVKSANPTDKSSEIKDFYVDDDVDKLSVDPNCLLNIISECMDRREVTENCHFQSSDEEAEEEFFTASDSVSSTSSSAYTTASSNKINFADAKNQHRKKGYHSTSNRGIQFSDIGFQHRKPTIQKLKRKVTPKMTGNSYTYQPDIIDREFTFYSKDFPVLKSP